MLFNVSFSFAWQEFIFHSPMSTTFSAATLHRNNDLRGHHTVVSVDVFFSDTGWCSLCDGFLVYPVGVLRFCFAFLLECDAAGCTGWKDWV